MRALLSVYDKSGVTSFGQGLIDLGWDLISTGGTFQTLTDAGLPVTNVADVTGFPEMLDERVKTLHPAIHGGILARRDVLDHLEQLDALDLIPIDLVVGNLYPFADTIRFPGISLEDATEQIDIGGPAMIRAAAKNFGGVIVITDPADFDTVIAMLASSGVSPTYRKSLAAKAFAHVSAYDALVAEYLTDDPGDTSFTFPREVTFGGRLAQPLRYGENPHQRSAAYRRLTALPQSAGVLDAAQLGGKDLSFNNLVDADAAWQAAWLSPRPTVAIVKHAIPCGLASRDELQNAFALAVEGDPVSAFGGVVALNRPVDAATAQRIGDTYFEVVIAPDFEPDALNILTTKPNLRVLRLQAPTSNDHGPWDIRLVAGGILVQDSDPGRDDRATWSVVTSRQPTPDELADLTYAWSAVRLVKSNAIVLVRDEAIVGIGSGQPNRVESVGIATRRAGDRATESVLASDAFFPFPDGIERAADAGVRAVIQPGGSMRDKRVIAAADAADIAMVITGTRHFRH